MSGLVSIVLPVRNAAETLARTLDSVARQTWTDWELVAVDDDSRDGSGELLREAARRDKRVRAVANPGRGLVAALNAGLAAARGELVARMDADDVMFSERLEGQVAWLQRDQGVGLVGCQVEFGGDRAAQAGYAAHVDWLNTINSPAEIWLNRFVESPLAHPSVTFRRELVERHGGYRDGQFPEDYELWLRWLDAGVRMEKVPDTLLTWSDSPRRASRVDPRYHAEAFFAVKAKYVARELAGSGGGREVWIAGAGRPTRKRAALLEEHGVVIAGYLDIDPRKIGGRVGGRPVVGPEAVPGPADAVVLSYVNNRGARDQVRTMLVGQGRSEGRDFWLCA